MPGQTFRCWTSVERSMQAVQQPSLSSSLAAQQLGCWINLIFEAAARRAKPSDAGPQSSAQCKPCSSPRPPPPLLSVHEGLDLFFPWLGLTPKLQSLGNDEPSSLAA